MSEKEKTQALKEKICTIWSVVAYNLLSDKPMPYHICLYDVTGTGSGRHRYVNYHPFENSVDLVERLIKVGCLKKIDNRQLGDKLLKYKDIHGNRMREVSGSRVFEVVNFEESKSYIRKDKTLGGLVNENRTSEDIANYYNELDNKDDLATYVYWHRDEFDIVVKDVHTYKKVKYLRKGSLKHIPYRLLRDVIISEMKDCEFGGWSSESLNSLEDVDSLLKGFSSAELSYRSEVIALQAAFLKGCVEDRKKALEDYRRAVIPVILKYAPMLAFKKVDDPNNNQEVSNFKRVLEHAGIFNYETLYGKGL